MARKKKTAFITWHSFLGYIAGGGAYFWSAWFIITFGTAYIGLWWANILGNGVGVILNYLIQRFLAFPGKHIFNSGWRFAAITAVNFILSYFILRFLTDRDVPLWLAQFISAGLFSVWNYVWYKLWVFKD